jgi:SAM-dependent methyltransferase
MGIINETARFLCEARAAGVSFRKTLMLGRQNFYVDGGTLETLARELDVSTTLSEDHAAYSEDFFRRFLMAEEISSLDYSDYQGAGITHDMNLPVPADLEQRYDAIVDGGTLEHVFNFPVAISNCMRMLRTGARLFIFTPANNQMGHGFYQFGPELFFRTLSPENGFEVERMVAVEFAYMESECGSLKRQYEVKDPDAAGERVTLRNAHPVGLMIQAKKNVHKSRIFERYPQQSDYRKVWATSADGAPGDALERPMSLAHRLARRLPRPIRRMLALEYHKYFTHSFRNRASYVPLGKTSAKR